MGVSTLLHVDHPARRRAGAPLWLSTDGELMSLGLHPDLHLSTFSVRTGDRLLFFTDGLPEARDRAGTAAAVMPSGAGAGPGQKPAR
jgi:phosphoserine phosphatase RsbU/P